MTSTPATAITVDDLEKIYDLEYRPATQRLFSVFRREEGERATVHSMRASFATRTSLEISNIMDAIRCAGVKFMRSFVVAYANPTPELRAYFESSGFARLTNVFVMIHPYETLKWTHTNTTTFPFQFSDLFEASAESYSVPVQVWESIIKPEFAESFDPFPEAVMKEIMG